MDIDSVSPARQYVVRLLLMLDSLNNNIGTTISASEAISRRLVEGGNLYITSDEKGFTAEACGRAGGMMMIQELFDPLSVKPQDAVVVGTLNFKPEEQHQLLQTLKKQKALTLLVGSSESTLAQEADLHLSNTLPLGTVPVISIGEKERICSIGGVANITTMWTFIGELVSACTRYSKMPTIYQSIFLPNGKERNARYSGYSFHDDITVPSISPGRNGLDYLSELKRCFEEIRDTQLQLYEKTGKLAADTIKNKHKVWCLAIGHHLPSQKSVPGDPNLFNMLYEGEKIENIAPYINKDDMFIYIGYYHYPREELEFIRKLGLKSAWIQGGREVTKIEAFPEELHIDTKWKYGDACVEIPGYDVKILPPSGVIQTSSLWMVIGETAYQLNK